MTTAFTVLAWLCLGLGIALALPELIKISRRNWPGESEPARKAARRKSWQDVRRFAAAAAAGLAMLGFYKTGPFSWIYGTPLLVLVPLNIAWWLTARIRRRLASQAAAAGR